MQRLFCFPRFAFRVKNHYQHSVHGFAPFPLFSQQFLRCINAMQAPIGKSFKTQGLVDHGAVISSRIREVRENPWLRAPASGIRNIWSYALGREK
jgi:hypothetical protein